MSINVHKCRCPFHDFGFTDGPKWTFTPPPLLTYTSLLGSKSFLFLHYFRITTRCNKQNCGYDACGQLVSLSHDSHLQKHYFVKYKVGFNKFVAIVNSTILKFLCYEL